MFFHRKELCVFYVSVQMNTCVVIKCCRRFLWFLILLPVSKIPCELWHIGDPTLYIIKLIACCFIYTDLYLLNWNRLTQNNYDKTNGKYEGLFTVASDWLGPLLLTWFNINPNMDK